MTIGEQLEEARTARHISLREAAEATKIRGDYLLAMEQNAISSIDLPDIYRRGFLRNYARYLKLDGEKIAAAYHGQQLGRASGGQATSASAGSGRQTLGRIEMAPDPEEPSENTGRPLRANEPEPAQSTFAPAEEKTPINLDPTLYIKIAVVLGSVIVLGILIWILVALLRGGNDTPALNPDLAAPTTQTQTIGATPEPQTPEEIIIRASDTVQLIVKDTASGATIFSGTLEAGEATPPIEKFAPLEIRFTLGSALTIEREDGRTERPGTAGVGRGRVE